MNQPKFVILNPHSSLDLTNMHTFCLIQCHNQVWMKHCPQHQKSRSLFSNCYNHINILHNQQHSQYSHQFAIENTVFFQTTHATPNLLFVGMKICISRLQLKWQKWEPLDQNTLLWQFFTNLISPKKQLPVDLSWISDLLLKGQSLREIEQQQDRLFDLIKTETYRKYLNVLLQVQSEIQLVEGSSEHLTDDHCFDDFFHPLFDNPENKSNETETTVLQKLFNYVITPSMIDSLLAKQIQPIIQQNIVLKGFLFLFFSQPNPILHPMYVQMTENILHQFNAPDISTLIMQLLDSSNFSKHALIRIVEKFLSASIVGTGPMMIKIFQQIKPSEESENIINITNILKSVNDDIMPMKEKHVRDIFDTLPINLTTKPKLLATASIGQVYRINVENELAILKIIRPTGIYYFISEMRVMLVDVWQQIRKDVDNMDYPDEKKRTLIQQSRQMLLMFVKNFINEFNMEIEAKYTNLGYETYNDINHLKSTRLLTFQNEPFPFLMETMVDGFSYQTFVDELKNYPNVDFKSSVVVRAMGNKTRGLFNRARRQGQKMALYDKHRKKTIFHVHKLLKDLYVTWVANVFWGNGFFHADLHPGNVFIGWGLQHLYLIDYGSAATLPQIIRNKLVELVFLAKKFHQFDTLLSHVVNSASYQTAETYSAQTMINMHPHKFVDFLPFFRSSKLTQEQWMALNAVLETKRTEHKKNLKNLVKFMDALYELCDVQTVMFKEQRYLFEELLDYDQDLDFDTVFFKFIKIANYTGTCMYSNIVLFARGLNYLMKNLKLLETFCINDNQCPPVKLDEVVMHYLSYKTPKEMFTMLSHVIKVMGFGMSL